MRQAVRAVGAGPNYFRVQVGARRGRLTSSRRVPYDFPSASSPRNGPRGYLSRRHCTAAPCWSVGSVRFRRGKAGVINSPPALTSPRRSSQDRARGRACPVAVRPRPVAGVINIITRRPREGHVQLYRPVDNFANLQGARAHGCFRLRARTVRSGRRRTDTGQ